MKTYYFRLQYFALIMLIVSSLTICGCKKFIEIDPPIDKTIAATVYANTDLAASAMTGIYAVMPNTFDFGESFSYSLGLLSDEFVGVSPDALLYQNNLIFGNTDAVWINSYTQLIFRCNSLIDGVSNSKDIPENSKALLLGEAKFMRAFTYFYLVNLYGDVPLVLTTDISTNSNIARTSKDEVYQQIIKDLKEAQATLSVNFLNVHLQSDAVERVRPNQAAATAMLARVYLYRGMWGDAEAEATKVINDGRFGLLDPSAVFLKNSKETIWAQQPDQIALDGPNTNDGKVFSTIYFTGMYRVAVGKSTSDVLEAGDKRADNWLAFRTDNTGTSYQIPFKYKIGQQDFTQPTQQQEEYNIVLRIAEQYLIRAEARTHMGNVSGAKDDLNAIRHRSGLGTTLASNESEMLAAIAKERQIEFFAEWGHRWLDLKRTGKIDEVMRDAAPLKVYDGVGATWSPFKSLFPIPISEFVWNQSLRGHQNPGYSEQ